ncbi:MAG: TolC family outer membrane protein [Gammaproteobacteria bacterium]|nr:TolC family outer membrane protein [Gammaproteobacteria bacterium]MDH5692833.1 TolC family outer membrane protein [Gammaproteobacteria bacterium]
MTRIWRVTSQLISRSLLFLSIATPCYAENIVEIVELSLVNETGLLQAQELRDASKAARRQTLGEFFPEIRLYGEMGNYEQKVSRLNNLPLTDPLTSATEGQLYRLEASVPLFDTTLFAKYSIADLKVTRSNLEGLMAKQEAILHSALAYIRVIQHTERLNLSRIHKNSASEQLDHTNQRLKLGLSSKADVLEATARHDTAVAEELLAETELSISRENLKRIVGQEFGTLSPLKDNAPLLPPNPASADSWIELANKSSPKLAIAEMEHRILKAETSMHRRAHLPKIHLKAYAEKVEDERVFGRHSEDSGALVEFSLPLYEGGKTSARTTETVHKAIAAKHQRESMQRQVENEIRDNFMRTLAALSHIKALRQAKESTTKAHNSIKAGFRVGSRSAVDVLNSLKEMLKAQKAYANARYEYIENLLKLKAASGKLAIDDIVSINRWLGGDS